MINAQLNLYILALSPNQISVLVDPNKEEIIPSTDIVLSSTIDNQLSKLYKHYIKDSDKSEFTRFRFVDLDILNNKLNISYMIVVGILSTIETDSGYNYILLENIANEYNQKIIQKIKNII